MSFKHYFTNKLSIQKSRLSDLLQTTYLPTTKRLSRAFRHHRLYRADQLPSKVDLRPDMTSIEDQSRIGSSVANCLAGAYEYLTKKSSGHNIHVSRLFIYYNARVKGNMSESVIDSGCSMTDAIEALEEFGTCLESIWPYDILHVNKRPHDEAYEQAENHKIHEALQINLDLNEMKSCLAQGFPFAFGLRLYKSFDKAAKYGIVSIPTAWEKTRKLTGSHALLAVGYSDRSKAFIVRNSWGEKWGDEGYCYIPYDYMANPDLCFDVWTIRKVANDDFGQEHWYSNDLVDYLGDKYGIETLDDEDYSTDNESQMNWKDYYYRKKTSHDSWNEYQNYGENDFSRNDEDYFDDRYRRDRYDRENELFDQHFEGYINNSYSLNRNFSYPYYDRFQNESGDLDYDRRFDNQRKSTF